MEWFSLWVLAAGYGYWFTQLHTGLGEYRNATFEALVHGSACTPMQYRALVPWLVRGVAAGAGALGVGVELSSLKFAIDLTAVVLLLVVVFAATRLLLAPRGGVMAAQEPSVWPWLGLLLMMWGLPLHVQYMWFYPYDIPSALLFTLGVVAIDRCSWRWFYALFVIATVNRETSCFLTVYLLLAMWRCMGRRALWSHAVAQAVLWVGIQGTLHALYRGNPSDCTVAGAFQNVLLQNLEMLRNRGPWAALGAVYGYLWIPLLGLAWYVGNPRLRRGLLVIPVFHVAMLIPGIIQELRIYTEMLPLVVWGVVGGMQALANGRPSQRTAGAAAGASG